ncbi:unnamed protein product, partial [Staurois parvus]
MPCRHITHQKVLPEKSVLEARETQAAAVNMDAVSALLVRTSAELEAVKRELAQVEADEDDQEQTCLGEEWLELQGEEAFDTLDEPGPTKHMNEYYSSSLQLSTDPEEPQTESYDETNSWDPTSTPLPAAELPTLVDKETNTEETVHENISVRPKDRSSLSGRQRPFVRNSMIVRSQTFSPGEKNQYICRLNRSDSDSSTLAKKSPFVRNATERRSLRVKRPVCPTMTRRAMHECRERTSLDL